MEKKHIGTHSGSFHMDEAMGVAMLTKYTTEWKDAKVTRTRDKTLLDSLDLILDVGGVYDPSKHKYDHHQKEFQDTFGPDYNIRLSSAGLIYRHFGKEVLKNVTEDIIKHSGLSMTVSEEEYELVYKKLYDKLILYVDAVDNGVEPYPKDIKAKYQQQGHLAQRVGRLNPKSYEKVTFDERFAKAVELCDEELREQVAETVLGWLRGRKSTEDAVKNRFEVHSSGQIIKMTEPGAWKSNIYDAEARAGCVGEIKFVLFADEAGGEGWRVQAVPIENGSFLNRRPLHKNWCGATPHDLKERSGIDDIVFCHVSGFIGGARSYGSALKMAELSLVNEEKNPEESKIEVENSSK